jgi:hypothetical protein
MIDSSIPIHVTPDVLEWDGVLDDMLGMIKDYSDESGYEYTFNGSKAEVSIRTLVEDPSGGELHALFGAGTLQGFAVIFLQDAWMDEMTGNLYMFYVKPQYRSYTKGSLLLTHCIKASKRLKCRYLFSGTLSRINPRITKAFLLLLQRKGFEYAGSSMVLDTGE